MSRQVPHAEDTATGTPTAGLVPISAGPGLAPAWGAAGGGGGGGSGGLALLYEFTCVGGESSVRLPATGVFDPSDYAAILLLWQARQNGSGDFSSTVGLELQLNDDTASHYRNMDSAARSNGATNAEGTTTGFTSTPRFYAGRITPSGADAAAAASGRILFPEAGRATFWQPILSDSLNSYSTTVDTQAVWSYGHWMQQAVITSITAICRNGAFGDAFVAGTHFKVYGINATSGGGGGGGALARCQLTRTANLTMVAGSYTTVPWDSEREDAGGLHSTGTNPDRVTVTEAGLYLLEGRFRFHRVTGTTTSQRIWSAFFKNNTDVIDSEDWFSIGQASSTTGPDESQFSMVATHRLAVGDYVNVQMANEGNGTVDLVVGAADNQTCEFVVTRLGG
jgi:hypothetical protein